MNFLVHRVMLASAAALLAACGGGKGSSTPPDQSPIVLSAMPDTAAVDWQVTSAIDVLANDKASRGGLALSAVSGAVNGTAVVANGKISYSPAPGFYGAERLVYTVAAADGSVNTKATLDLTVNAALTLSGVAGDVPLPNATVSATLDGKVSSAVTDATGSYTLTLRSTNPAAFVVLDAAGNGARAAVKMSSLLGDVASLAKLASGTGQLNAGQLPAVRVTPVSTAFHALATRINHGRVPATAAELKNATDHMDVEEQLRLATAVKLAVDKGVPLPAGIDNTQVLTSDENAVTAIFAAAAGTDGQLPRLTRLDINLQALPAGPAFSLKGMPQRWIAYNFFSVLYKADGTGKFISRFDQQDITWKADGAKVLITLAHPQEYQYEAGDVLVNGTRSLYAIKDVVDGMIIEHVVNAVTIKHGDTGVSTWIDGPDAGKPVVGSNVPMNVAVIVSSARDMDQPDPIPASLTAPGSILAGIYSSNADLLEFVSDTEARFLNSGRTVSWGRHASKNTIWIQDRTAGAIGIEWELSLLGTSAITGQQQWFAYDRVADTGHPAVVMAADKPRPLFNAELALKKWREPYNLSNWSQPLPDGSLAIDSKRLPGYTSGWWVTPDNGDLILYFKNPSHSGTMFRRMTPIKWLGNRLYYLHGSTIRHLELLP